jgi:hypothetical protein
LMSMAILTPSQISGKLNTTYDCQVKDGRRRDLVELGSSPHIATKTLMCRHAS